MRNRNKLSNQRSNLRFINISVLSRFPVLYNCTPLSKMTLYHFYAVKVVCVKQLNCTIGSLIYFLLSYQYCLCSREKNLFLDDETILCSFPWLCKCPNTPFSPRKMEMGWAKIGSGRNRGIPLFVYNFL